MYSPVPRLKKKNQAPLHLLAKKKSIPNLTFLAAGPTAYKTIFQNAEWSVTVSPYDFFPRM